MINTKETVDGKDTDEMQVVQDDTSNTKTRTINHEQDEEMQEAIHYCDILKAYANYATYIFQKFNRIEADFRSIPKIQQALIPSFEKKLRTMRACVGANQLFIRKILNERWVFMGSDTINYDWVMRKKRSPSTGDMDKVVSTLKQCVRDWSIEGKEERSQCYGPILKEIQKLFPKPSSDIRVLVPGCGLSRLVWEIANAGFHAQGNEFSYFMLLCSFLLLNCTNRVNAYRIFPYIHQTNNTYSPRGHLTPVSFPDVDPSQISKAHLSMVAGDFQEIYENQEKKWNCIATCFFIDTANNIIEYIRLISKLLKVGGYWVNFGPLLYHYSGMKGEISVELSWEEIKSCFKHYGLKLIREEKRQPATYCFNIRGMMQTRYFCVSSTCVKVSETPMEQPAPRFQSLKRQEEAANHRHAHDLHAKRQNTGKTGTNSANTSSSSTHKPLTSDSKLNSSGNDGGRPTTDAPFADQSRLSPECLPKDCDRTQAPPNSRHADVEKF